MPPLDELAEVYPGVGDVVENGFSPVALIFHVADLHVQAQFGGDLSRPDHGLVLPCLGLLVLLEVRRFGFAVDALYVGAFFLAGAFHLQGDEASRERHDADVVPRAGFDGYDVAFLERQSVVVAVVSFARILELHFHKVGRVLIAGDVGHVVVGVELFILSSASLGAKPA